MVAGEAVGCRLLVTLIDQYAAEEPDRVWAVLPVDDNDLSRGFKDVTYREFANAINIAAVWLSQNLPPSSQEFETIAYAGPKDIRYPIIAVAAAKLKRKLLLPSPYASVGAQTHLITASKCKVFLHGEACTSIVQQVLNEIEESATRSLQFPELSEFLWQDPAPDFPYEKTWSEAKDDPWLIFHTSGTTGRPKLIPWTHAMMAFMDTIRLLPDSDKNTTWNDFAGRRCYTPLPSLHIVGMLVSLQFPLVLCTTVVVGPVTAGPTTPSIAAAVLKFSHAQTALLPPALIDGLCSTPEGLTALRQLDCVHFGGAPLARRTAEKLLPYTPVRPTMGTTECGPYLILNTGNSDWEYYTFASSMGMHMQPIAPSSEIAEAVFIRTPELERWQQIFTVYPELSEYRTKDLFQRHPERRDAWRFVGRTDDMVAFSHGEGLYATAVEDKIVASNPLISAALVGGQGRPNPFLLLELRDNADRNEEQKREVSRSILETVNRKLSDLVKLTPELVLFTSPEKPLVRTIKGSISRIESEKLFAEEINMLYDTLK